MCMNSEMKCFVTWKYQGLLVTTTEAIVLIHSKEITGLLPEQK
jgi:hypothetical protein